MSSNIASSADITASPTAYNTYWTSGIANGIISTLGDLDYEYHSASANAFINFNFPYNRQIGKIKIHNRVWCCSSRLTNATIRLYDDNGTVLYTHTLWNTQWVSVIDINFKDIWEIYSVKEIRLDSVWGNVLNLREIEIFSIEENIELYKWNWMSWWNDVSETYIDSDNISITDNQSIIPTKNLVYGKYKSLYRVYDNAGNSSIHENIFYVDEPEFTISTSTIDLWTISPSDTHFSDTVKITVKTIWAPFRIYMDRSSAFTNGKDSINSWDNSQWYGYQKAPYINNISEIAIKEEIGSHWLNINTSGEKNIYSFDIQIGALVANDMISWNYKGHLDFSISLDY